MLHTCFDFSMKRPTMCVKQVLLLALFVENTLAKSRSSSSSSSSRSRSRSRSSGYDDDDANSGGECGVACVVIIVIVILVVIGFVYFALLKANMLPKWARIGSNAVEPEAKVQNSQVQQPFYPAAPPVAVAMPVQAVCCPYCKMALVDLPGNQQVMCPGCGQAIVV
ncbi:hypothetical protein CYMTET_16906 [Cymbomonas tetramitiformis]|uniref:Uncharacterized protein n=1 Tax=Cymbomonas tetramitiformis TaxID=36881 RepID=A0AAE0GCH7_9CHLO|nr:hypothetical protein CYMTET_16906 [Cymbomonas tetramitiformis]